MSETKSAKDSPDKVVKLVDTVKVEAKAVETPIRVVSKADRPKETLTVIPLPAKSLMEMMTQFIKPEILKDNVMEITDVETDHRAGFPLVKFFVKLTLRETETTEPKKDTGKE